MRPYLRGRCPVVQTRATPLVDLAFWSINLWFGFWSRVWQALGA